MLKTNVEDQLKQAENKQQQGAAVIIHSSPVVVLHLIKQPKKTNVSFVYNIQNPP